MQLLQAESSADDASSAAAQASRLEALALHIQRSAAHAMPTKEVKTLKDFDYHVRHSDMNDLKPLSKNLRLLSTCVSLLKHADGKWLAELRERADEAIRVLSQNPASSVVPCAVHNNDADTVAFPTGVGDHTTSDSDAGETREALDGLLYTKMQFIKHYGEQSGLLYWNQATGRSAIAQCSSSSGPQFQYDDAVVEVQIQKQVHVPTTQKVEKTVEVPQLQVEKTVEETRSIGCQVQDDDVVVEVPIQKQAQVPVIQKVEKIVEMPQVQYEDVVFAVPLKADVAVRPSAHGAGHGVTHDALPRNPISIHEKSVEEPQVPQVEFSDKVADVPVQKQIHVKLPIQKQKQVPMIQKMGRTVGVPQFQRNDSVAGVPIQDPALDPMIRKAETSVEVPQVQQQARSSSRQELRTWLNKYQSASSHRNQSPSPQRSRHRSPSPQRLTRRSPSPQRSGRHRSPSPQRHDVGSPSHSVLD